MDNSLENSSHKEEMQQHSTITNSVQDKPPELTMDSKLLVVDTIIREEHQHQQQQGDELVLLRMHNDTSHSSEMSNHPPPPHHHHDDSHSSSGQVLQPLTANETVIEPVSRISNQIELNSTNIEEEMMNIPDGLTRKQRILHHLKLGKNEVIQVLKLCWPAVVMNVCFQLLGLESLSFIGHLTLDESEIPAGVSKDKVGELYMAAASLGNSFFFCLGFVLVGLTNGQSTLVSQAVGAKNFTRAGQVLARSLFTIFVVSIPICVILCFANYALYWMNQEQVLVELVGYYLRVLTPGMIPFVICEALSLYLIANDILMPNVIIWVISVIINFGLNWLLVFGLGFRSLGFIGAPIALSITRYIMLIMYIVIIYFKGYMRETWKGFVDFKTVFKWFGFKEYLKMALPGSVMLAAEVWGFELSTITSSFLGATALASHSIVLNICALTFMIPLSIATATAIKIGQYMGAREPIKAKYSGYSAMVFSGLFMFFSGGTLAICREWIPQIYTQDQDIIYNASIIFPLCALFQLFDGMQAIAGAIIRGIGKQTIGAASTLIAYYVIGLPIGAVLAFVVGWGLVGIWSGLAIALIAVFVGMLLYIWFRIDWHKESEIAFHRASTTQEDKISSLAMTTTPTIEMTSPEEEVNVKEKALNLPRVITPSKVLEMVIQQQQQPSASDDDDDEDYSRVNSRVNLLIEEKSSTRFDEITTSKTAFEE